MFLSSCKILIHTVSQITREHQIFRHLLKINKKIKFYKKCNYIYVSFHFPAILDKKESQTMGLDHRCVSRTLSNM